MKEAIAALFKHPVIIKAGAKFGKADRLEHVGYLGIMALVEHNLLRVLALIVLAVVILACWFAHE